MERQAFLRTRVAEDGRVDVPYVLGRRRAAAIVVRDDLQEVRRLSQLPIVLGGPVKRAERFAVPGVPAYVDAVVDAFRRSVNEPVNFLVAVSPEFFPREDSRVVQQNPQKSYKGAVGGPLAGPGGSDKLIELNEPLPSSFDRDSALATLLNTVLAEAGNPTPPGEPTVMRADSVVERPLALGPPHDAVHVVGLDPVFDEGGQEAAQLGMVEAGLAGAAPIGVKVGDLLEIRQQARVIHVLEPAEAPHLSGFGLGGIGRASCRERC